MDFNKKELLEMLKLEIMVIEKGGYHPSVHSPHDDPRIFRDSVSCLNVGLPDDKKKEPCSSCKLIEFVPAEFRGSNDDPCHKIPLNEKGDTVESLSRQGDRETLQAAVLAWLKRTVARLESELAAE
jgi:hypothetical protein